MRRRPIDRNATFDRDYGSRASSSVRARAIAYSRLELPSQFMQAHHKRMKEYDAWFDNFLQREKAREERLAREDWLEWTCVDRLRNPALYKAFATWEEFTRTSGQNWRALWRRCAVAARENMAKERKAKAAAAAEGLAEGLAAVDCNLLDVSMFADFADLAVKQTGGLFTSELEERMRKMEDRGREQDKSESEKRKFMLRQKESLPEEYRKHIGQVTADQADESKFGQYALGSKWKEVGSQKPTKGTLINNEALTTNLQQKTDFSLQELRAFNVGKLSCDSYIKVGDKYFKPAEP